MVRGPMTCGWHLVPVIPILSLVCWLPFWVMPRWLRPDRKIGVITDGDDLYLEYVDRLPCLPTWLPILEPRQLGRLFFLEHDLRARKIPLVTSLRLHWRYVHWRDRIPHFECPMCNRFRCSCSGSRQTNPEGC